MESSNPALHLTEATSIQWEGEDQLGEDQELVVEEVARKHVDEEIEESMKDLRVLGRGELKKLMRWRNKVVKEVEKTQAENNPNKEEEEEEDQEDEEEKEEREIRDLMDKKSAERKLRKKKDKKRKRLQRLRLLKFSQNSAFCEDDEVLIG